jgi:hypothetical protein
VGRHVRADWNAAVRHAAYLALNISTPASAEVMSARGAVAVADGGVPESELSVTVTLTVMISAVPCRSSCCREFRSSDRNTFPCLVLRNDFFFQYPLNSSRCRSFQITSSAL